VESTGILGRHKITRDKRNTGKHSPPQHLKTIEVTEMETETVLTSPNAAFLDSISR
jgi:hypothetical protein